MSKKNKYEKYWKYDKSIWKSESAWFSWIRSALRKSWNRHPTKVAKLQKERFKIPNPNTVSAKRFPEIWGGKCSCCGNVFPLSAGKKEGLQKTTIQVDHLTPSGSLKDVSDLQGFAQRLFCVSLDDLALICSVCNKTKDLMVKLGVSFEEAKAEREAIAIIKSKQERTWLTERGIMPASSQVNRRRQVVEQLLKGSANEN